MGLGTLYVTQAGQLALQTGGLAGWANPIIDLCSAVPAIPGFHAVIGDFVLAAYTGYAHQTFTLVGGYVLQAILKSFATTTLIKFPLGTAAFESEVGFVISDSIAHTVWAWGTFQGPLPILTATDLIALIVELFDDLSSSVNTYPVAP